MPQVTPPLDDMDGADGGNDEASEQSHSSGGGSGRDFLDALLAALTQMAGLSPRRQADVAVAMRRAGLAASPEAVQEALGRLCREGCIESPLPLMDGGILVSVTARGIERLATTAHRHVVATMMSPDVC